MTVKFFMLSVQEAIIMCLFGCNSSHIMCFTEIMLQLIPFVIVVTQECVFRNGMKLFMRPCNDLVFEAVYLG